MLKKELKHLDIENFRNIDVRIDAAEVILDKAHTVAKVGPLNFVLQETVGATLDTYVDLRHHHLSLFKQKAKVN